MGWDLGIVLIAQRGVGFQRTFSEFPAFGGIAALLAFLWGGRLLSGISSPKGSGRAHGSSWQTHTRKMVLRSQHCTLTSAAQIWFDPKWEHHFQCLVLKPTTVHKTCLSEAYSKNLQLRAHTSVYVSCFLLAAHHLLYPDVHDVRGKPLEEQPRKKSCKLSGCKVVDTWRFLTALPP